MQIFEHKRITEWSNVESLEKYGWAIVAVTPNYYYMKREVCQKRCC